MLAPPRQAASGQFPLVPLAGAGQCVPLVQGGQSRYVNLDYAASAPALQPVAERVTELLQLYASVHLGAGYASQACTAAYEAARRDVASFAGAGNGDVVIFTRNTTDALNLLASATPGPVVHLDIEHHANLLPWQARGGRVVLARATLAGTLAALEAELGRAPAALLSVTGASNVTGECLPLPEIASLAHRHGARVAVDGAQLVPHRRVDMRAIKADYLAFSGHKIYAPFGAGALIGKRDWLDAAPPFLAGGGAVRHVTVEAARWASSPERHEAGTPNVIGAVALATACQVIAALPDGARQAHESALLHRLDQGLAAVGARVHRIWPGPADRVPVVSFSLPGQPAAPVSAPLSAKHWTRGRRAGFCGPPPLPPRRGASDGAVRASLGLGSQADDVDRLITALDQLRADGPAWTYTADHRPSPDTRPMPAWASPGSTGGGPACSAGE